MTPLRCKVIEVIDSYQGMWYNYILIHTHMDDLNQPKGPIIILRGTGIIWTCFLMVVLILLYACLEAIDLCQGI